jgi:flagellar M-ring protein FliF
LPAGTGHAALPAGGHATALSPAAAHAQLGSGAPVAIGGHAGTPLALPRQSQVATMIDLAQVEGQVKESSIRKVGEIINNHPEEAVSILCNWLYQAE